MELSRVTVLSERSRVGRVHRRLLGKEPTVTGHYFSQGPTPALGEHREIPTRLGSFHPSRHYSPVPAIHLQAHHGADEPCSLQVIMFVTLGVSFIPFPGRVVRKPEFCHILWRTMNNADEMYSVSAPDPQGSAGQQHSHPGLGGGVCTPTGLCRSAARPPRPGRRSVHPTHRALQVGCTATPAQEK